MICFDIFRDVERLYPPGSVRLSNNKVSFGLENEKLINKLLVLECQKFYVKLETLLVLGVDPSFLYKSTVQYIISSVSFVETPLGLKPNMSSELPLLAVGNEGCVH